MEDRISTLHRFLFAALVWRRGYILSSQSPDVLPGFHFLCSSLFKSQSQKAASFVGAAFILVNGCFLYRTMSGRKVRFPDPSVTTSVTGTSIIGA